METRSNHVLVGAVTLALLALLAAFIVWIVRIGQANQREYDVFFSQAVDGLSKGSSVNFSGVPVGQVRSIELWRKDPSFVRVRISIDPDVPVLVGTTATMLGSFTGVSNIQLEGAVKDAPPIACPEENPRATCPEGVPVIPTKRGGLGELLNSAPVLLERLATLTERMTLLLSDKNQKSLENILSNTDRLTGNLANASPQVAGTLTELQATLKQATLTLANFEKVAGSADQLLNQDGSSLVKQLRATLTSAKTAADSLQSTLDAAQPATRRLSETTLPAAEAAIRDLRATTRALRDVTEKIDDQGAASLLGAPPLPDYKP